MMFLLQAPLACGPVPDGMGWGFRGLSPTRLAVSPGADLGSVVPASDAVAFGLRDGAPTAHLSP